MTKPTIFGLVGVLMLCTVLRAQQPAPTAAPIEHRDAALEAAERLTGRALILRCFCAENDLAFDADGRPQQANKMTDWTLAGVNVTKAERRDPKTIELDGVRVAIRFAPDRREFDRHPLNEMKVKIFVEDGGQGARFERTLDTVFAEGLDLRLQRAMPAFWQHYFLPATPWPKDALDGQMIVTPGTPAAPAGLTDPRATKRAEADYTPEAAHDRVQGFVLMRMVVDAQGVPQHVVVTQPLGYGLDARAAQAVERYRFEPAKTVDGKAVAANAQVREEFTLVPSPK